MALVGSSPLQHEDQVDADFFEQFADDLQLSGPDCRQEGPNLNDIFAKLSVDENNFAGMTPQTLNSAMLQRQTKNSTSNSAGDRSVVDDFNSEEYTNSERLRSQEIFFIDESASPLLDSPDSGPDILGLVGAVPMQSGSDGYVASSPPPLESPPVGVVLSSEKDNIENVPQHSPGSDPFGGEASCADVHSFGSEDSQTMSCMAPTSMDSGLSSPEAGSIDGSGSSFPGAKVQLQTSYKQLEWSTFSEICTSDDQGALISFPDFLLEKPLESDSLTVPNTGGNANTPFCEFVSEEQEQERVCFSGQQGGQRPDPYENSGIRRSQLGAMLELDSQVAGQLQIPTTESQPSFDYIDSREVGEVIEGYGHGIIKDSSMFLSEGQQLQGYSSLTYKADGTCDQQENPQQSWENLYPGWYYDYNVNEWRQVEGYDASGVSWALTFDGQKSGEMDSQSGVTLSKEEGRSSELNNREHVGLQDQYHNNAAFSENQSRGLAEQEDGAASSQKGAGLVESYIQHGNSSWQQPTGDDAGLQQQLSWEQQYPGWYYDYQAQEWRETTQKNKEWQLGQMIHQSQEWPLEFDSSSNTLYDTSQMSLKEPSFNSWADVSSSYSSDYAQGFELNSNQQPVTKANHIFERGPVLQPVISDNQMHGAWPVMQGWENEYNNDYSQATSNGAYSGNQQASSCRAASATIAPRTTAEALISSVGRPPHAVAAFGFGGKLVLMKLREPGMLCGGAGDQVFARGQTWTSGLLVTLNLSQVVVENVSKRGSPGSTSYFTALSGQGFTGPLVGGNVATKDLFRWVDERVTNCEAEEPEYSNPEALRVLWCLLKIACQHYGKLRSPIGTTSNNTQGEDGPEESLGKLLTSVKSQSFWNKGSGAIDSLQAVPAEHQLQVTAIEMKNLLVAGKRKEALQCAQQGQLWGPAMVLAWQLGEKFYADTVTLMAKQHLLPGSPLRTLCLLLAGQATEVFATKPLVSPSSAFASNPVGAPSSVQDGAVVMLENWLENLAIIAANRTKGDEQVIMHLGDCLWKARGEVAGAHTCYLVADASFEPFSGNARLCLVGADHFKHPRTFSSPESIQRTEVYEYAKVLGNPQFILVPFQPYKLVYAHMLAEAGKTTEAIRYCQAISKTLKNIGRAPEVEYCRHAATALEDRLRLHSQGGYLNLARGKLVGKLMSTIDSTIHKIIGGPPPDAYASGPRMGITSTRTSPTPLVPSASMEPIRDFPDRNTHGAVPPRSISEPAFSKNSKQEEKLSSDYHSPQYKVKRNVESSSGGYFGRFGSQFFAKAVGLMRHNKQEAKLGEDNRFHYDEKLKRWVEEGVEPNPEEVALPPPPIVPKFAAKLESSPLDKKYGTVIESQAAVEASGSLGFAAGMPPLPPSVNEFSARARLQGVRSRYVDTFNRGASSPSIPKPNQSPIIPSAGLGLTSAPAKIFVPTFAPASGANDECIEPVDNSRLHEGDAELASKAIGDAIGNGHAEIEDVPLVPRNLSFSFMEMPPMQRHSSADNVANNKITNGNAFSSGMHGGGTENGNRYVSRAVSWSGYSTFEEAKETSASTVEATIYRPVHAGREKSGN